MLPARSQIELIDTRWGPMYGFVNDVGVSEALRTFGEYAAFEIGLYQRLLGTDEVFVDVGCNIGVIARAVAMGPGTPSVIAFEPQPHSYRLALLNTLVNDNVLVYQIAASDSAGLLLIDEIDTQTSGNYGKSQANGKPSSNRRFPCPSVRLDDFLAPRAPRPRLIKIDVEGSETAVLRGLDGLVHERLVISVEADRRDQAPSILGELQRFGCTCFALFMRAISESNPRFDRKQLHCRIRHIHFLAFAGEPPPWAIGCAGVWRIDSPGDFDEVWNQYFPADVPARRELLGKR